MVRDRTLSDLRRERALTQEGLAKVSGVAVETIGKIERGETKNPQPFIFDALRIALEVDHNTLFSAISCSHVRNNTGGKSAKKDDYLKQYKFCEEVFHTLAASNAKCDIEIFHELFLDYMPKKMSSRETSTRILAIASCMKTVRTNIVSILDAIVELFEAMMGERCAACLQVLVRSSKFLSVKTVERDRYSARNRHIGRQRSIAGNTISERIFLNGEKLIIINDIAGKIASGSIQTTSNGAGQVYNAAFVVAIPDVRSTGEISTHSTIATLCVDSRHAFRQDRIEVCTHFAQEIAFRLGAMNYRLDNLAFHYGELQKLNGSI